MYNLKQIQEKDFKFVKGEYEIDWESRKKVFSVFSEGMAGDCNYRFLNVKIAKDYCD